MAGLAGWQRACSDAGRKSANGECGRCVRCHRHRQTASRQARTCRSPFVPKHEQTNPGGPAIVEVELVVDEGKRVIDESGTEVHTLTFNDSIPGPLIICPEGDYVELTLKNPHLTSSCTT